VINAGVKGWDRTGLILIGSGLMMGLAPVNAWPLAWFALVPLWQVAQRPRQSFRRALAYTAIWGIAYHGTALSWITGLHPMMWMGVPWLGSVAIALFAWVFITLWGAAIGMTWMALMLAITKWQPVKGATRVLLGTALWCAVEWVWSQGPLYWSSLSYTQSPYNLLALHLGQLAGPITVTAAIVAVNGGIAEAIGRYSQSYWQPLVREFDRRAAILTVCLFIGVHLLGFGLYSRSLADRPDEAISVGLIQGNVPTSQKMTGQGIQASRQIYLDGYEALVDQGADLVITPEGAIPQEWDAFLQDRNLFVRAVANRDVPLVLGTFVPQIIDDRSTPITQSLLTLTPEGEVGGRYNKVKLVPLGEYIPFEKVLYPIVGRFSPFAASMVPGTFQQMLETPIGPMAAGICYESAFAELFRQQVARGGQAIVTASNNDPYSPRQMMQHHAQDVMRAVETDRWAARVTNTGISGVVDHQGRSHWLSEPNYYAARLETIYRRQTLTPYVRWGDWLTPLLLVAAIMAVGFGRR